jgi:multidrug efflux system membrane fusion protein
MKVIHLNKVLIPILSSLIVLLSLVSCEKKVKPKKPLPAVSIGKVEMKDAGIYIETIGQVIPPVTVQIRPQVAGKLINTHVVQGDEVKAGQVLYTIDPRPYQAALDLAQAVLVKDEALLAIAEKTEQRFSKVVEEDYISKLTFEQFESTTKAAKAQVEADRASVIQAKINLEWTEIVAPVDGKISDFLVDVGNIVVADDTNAITIIRPHDYVDILFTVPQHQFALVRQHQGDKGDWKFNASLPEAPEKVYEGTSFFIDNQLSPLTGTLSIRGRLPNFERQLWPGEYIKVNLLQNIVSQALTVPPGAVLIGRNGPYVYTYDTDGKVAVKNVKVIYRSEAYLIIESDELKDGDTVVTDGQINIAPGMAVNVITPEKK